MRFLSPLIVILMILRADGGRANDQQALENSVKTAFVYQFTRYVSWPAARSKRDFRIAVVGGSALLPGLRELSATKSVRDARIIVEAAEVDKKLRDAHVVLIGDPALAAGVLSVLGESPVLTISHGDGLAQRGVVINFYLLDGKLRFEINRSSAKRAGLEISSQLFKLARVVE